ncbi:MAG TPA: hypothetical protein VL945_01250 [Candidatus Saccharimonadales bacterium]|nr:hypothetical protein [Candidatus Saccharimonadales bacterium]
MGRAITYILIVIGLLLSMPLVSAVGYGTSRIVLSESSISINQGSGGSVNYTVELASGNSWGTSVSVANQNQLAAANITVTLSDTYNFTVPFSGTMAVSASTSTPEGSYNVTLQATGDDPSTANTALVLEVMGPIVPAPVSGNSANSTPNSTAVGIAGNVQRAAANSTNGSTAPYTGNPGGALQTSAQSSGSHNALILAGILVLMLIISAYLVSIMKTMSTRMVILGVLLILAGTAVWLYGDYGGGPQYIWPGVIGILLGTLIWVYGDYVAGAFKMSK